MARRRGFSLAEFLLVLLIISTMAGALCVHLAGVSEEAAVRKEAEALAAWLEGNMTRALTEETGFKLQAYWAGEDCGTVELRLTRSGAEGNELQEVYRAERAVIKKHSEASLFTYSCRWHSFTPALTLYVRPLGAARENFYKVTVSGYGFVSVAPGTFVLAPENS